MHTTSNIKLEHATISTNGINLHVVMAGPQSGPPILFLHGFPEFWRGWIRQLPTLVEAGCRVIIPDQRGYNLSDKPRGVKAYRMEELVNDVLGLIDALDYEKVNLVGHDWGGIVAWFLALQQPKRLHRLVVMNAPHPSVMRRFLQRDLDQLRRSWYALMFQLPWLPEAGMRVGNWHGAERTLRGSGKIHTFAKDDILEYKKAWAQPGAMTAMINWYRAAFWHRPSMPKVLHVQIPTLMIWGTKDVAFTHRLARPSIEYCVDGKLIFFPDATHWVQHEEAEEVNLHLLHFIKA